MSLWQSFKRLPEQEQKRQFEILAKSDMQRIRMEVWIEEEGERTNVCVRSGKTGSPSGWIDSEADLVSLARDAQ